MKKQPSLIIADPDKQIHVVIAAALAGYFTIYDAVNLQGAYHLVQRKRPALLILGLEQRDGDGLAFLTTLRETWSRDMLAISCLSSRNDVPTKVDAFRRGADDYVVKPMHTLDEYSYHLRLLWHMVHVQSTTISQ